MKKWSGCRITLVTLMLLGMMLMTCHAAWHPGKGKNYITWPFKLTTRTDETKFSEMAQTNDTAQETVDESNARVTPTQSAAINNKIVQRMESNSGHPEAFLRASAAAMSRNNQERMGTRCYLIAEPVSLTLMQRRLFKRDVTTDTVQTPNIVNAGLRASDFRERLINLGLLKPVTDPPNTVVGLGAAKTAAALELGKAAVGVDLKKNLMGLGLFKKAAAAPVALLPLKTAAAPVVLPLKAATAPVVLPLKAAAVPLVFPLKTAAAPVVLPLKAAAAPVALLPLKTAAAPVVLPLKAVAAPVVLPLKTAAAPLVFPVTTAGIGMSKLAAPKLLALGGGKKVAEAVAVGTVASKGLGLTLLKPATMFGGINALRAKENVAEIGAVKPLAVPPLKGLEKTADDQIAPKPIFGSDWKAKISELGLFPNLIKPIERGRAAHALSDVTESTMTHAKEVMADKMQAEPSNIVPVKVAAPRRNPSRELEAAATIALENIGLENSIPLSMQDHMEENEMTTRTETSKQKTEFELCMDQKCVLSQKFDPICGTDGIMYQNLSHLLCAQLCGKAVHVSAMQSCPEAEATTIT